MCKFLVLPFLCLAFLFSAGTQRRDTNAGFYELTFLQKRPDGSSRQHKAIYFFRKEKDALKIVDIAFNQRFIGRVDGNEMSFGLEGRQELGWPKKGRLTLRGSLGDKKFSGQINNSDPFGGYIEVNAEELASVWACSNHEKPVHTAKSEEEIRELTAKYQCERWHRLKESEITF